MFMLKGIKKNELLSKHTTFKIGGPAKYFYIAKDEQDLEKALSWAKENNEPCFILGRGSNLLVSDQGYGGLVIKINNKQLAINNKQVMCGSGVSLSELIKFSVDNGYTGLEWAAGIPGTAGGAVRGNAGAFGNDMSKSVMKVKAVSIKQSAFSIKHLSNKECKFKYRESIFKNDKNLIILEVAIKLEKCKDKNEQKKLVEGYIKQRTDKQPKYPSAGSVFKNVLEKDIDKKYRNKIPNEVIKGGKIPAGWLIEEAQLKRQKVGKAQISEKHANFIVNLGGAKAEEVVSLISMAKMRVRNEFGVQLEEEIELVGF